MGAVSRRARSEADQFYYDLVYGPRRRPRQWAEAEPTLYTTGAVAARPGWTFVAYLGPRVARLAFNVLRPTPAGRIGNVGWVTNNPGSIDLSPPFKIVNGARVKSGVGERAAVDHGAFEKNLTDIKDYRRFAVFPTLELGERAVLPVLFVFARANNNPRVGEVLRIYYGIQDPAARVRYENEIRARLAVLIVAPIGEQGIAEAVLVGNFEIARGYDLISIYVGLRQRRAFSRKARNWFHRDLHVVCCLTAVRYL